MSFNPSILITGDFCPVNRTADLISEAKIELLFNDFLSFVKNAGLAVTNLECPLTDSKSKISKSGPALKAPFDTAEILSKAGFNLVSLANNHIMDYGPTGLTSTLDACNHYNIGHVGAGAGLDQARAAFITKQGNTKIAILNFAENEFSTTNDNHYGSNPIDPVENYYDILKAKRDADHVIVIVHGGHEMYNLPSPRIKSTFRFYADAGASVILSHHAHCYSGYEVFKGVPIFYGLGNLVFDKPSRRNSPWNYGYAVELFIDKSVTFSVIPYEQSNAKPGVRLLEGKDKREFHDNIEYLNSIISDDALLKAEFVKYCNKVKERYLSFLEPHSFNLIHSLRSRRLFPSLLTGKKKTLYLNLMRCESHREVLLNLLDTRESLKDI